MSKVASGTWRARRRVRDERGNEIERAYFESRTLFESEVKIELGSGGTRRMQ